MSTMGMKMHDFVRSQFNKPTYCQLCDKFIWGLMKQGFSCTLCGYPCHKGCLTKSKTTPCRGEKSKDNPLDSYLSSLLNTASPNTSPEVPAEGDTVTATLENYIDATDQGILVQSQLEQAKEEEERLQLELDHLETEHTYLTFIVEQLETNGFS
ncbi:MAG: hypothetical protein Q8P67_19370 [archaeon]|nr:hypothetical protein [archaeon]